MSGNNSDLAPYPVLLDGAAHVITLPAYYQAHGLIVVNNGSVELTVTSARGESWTVAPGGRLEAPQPTPAPAYTFQSERADPNSAQASATFTQALIQVLTESTPTTSTVPVADITLLAPAQLGPNLLYQFAVSIPPDVQSVSVVFAATHGLGNGVKLTGQQSGATYINASVTAPASDQYLYTAAIFPDLDTTLNLAVSTGNFPGTERAIVSLIGHRTLIGPPVSQRGTPYVTLDTSAGAVAVQLSGAQPTVPVASASPLAVTGIPRAAPAYQAAGSANNPAARTVIASTSVTVAGTYRIVVTGSNNDTAAAGRWLELDIAGVAYAIIGTPGALTLDLPALALAASTVIQLQSGTALAAGAYAGAILVYAL